MKLYHVTTPKKLARYISTGAILPPVRGFAFRARAEEWAKRTGRTVILEIEGGPAYPLPDHRPHAYWIDDFVRDWKEKE